MVARSTSAYSLGPANAASTSSSKRVGCTLSISRINAAGVMLPVNKGSQTSSSCSSNRRVLPDRFSGLVTAKYGGRVCGRHAVRVRDPNRYNNGLQWLQDNITADELDYAVEQLSPVNYRLGSCWWRAQLGRRVTSSTGSHRTFNEGRVCFLRRRADDPTG